ncbi:MAG: hypothetical protein ACI4D0_10635 [Lachnospira sp.]
MANQTETLNVSDEMKLEDDRQNKKISRKTACLLHLPVYGRRSFNLRKLCPLKLKDPLGDAQ